MHHQLSSPEQWLQNYGDILYRYALTRVRDRQVAEDLVQETLLAAIKARQNFAGKASERTWLTGILKHKVIDYFRKSARENSREFSDTELNTEDEYFDQQGHWQIDISAWSKPDKQFEQQAFLAVLQDCIDRLPKRMAQLFMLREFEGMDSDEICQMMKISSKNNLWVMLSRLRGQLRHCLDLHWNNH